MRRNDPIGSDAVALESHNNFMFLRMSQVVNDSTCRKHGINIPWVMGALRLNLHNICKYDTVIQGYFIVLFLTKDYCVYDFSL